MARHAAHPRVSGENWRVPTLALWIGGSSPRERGKLSFIGAGWGADWLIPA